MQTITETTNEITATTAYKTDAIAHGIGNSAVSNNWWNRPADERFLSIDEMLAHKQADAAGMTDRIVNTHNMKIEGQIDESNLRHGHIEVTYTDENGAEHINTPSNWSFNQLAQLAGAPAGYLRSLPAPLAADNMQWGLTQNRGKELIKTYSGENSGSQLRAATGPDYGRIYDHELLTAIKQFADPERWKVPGMMVAGGLYDPFVPVSLDTTTLFASDRDVFVFLVDDTHPIEIGKLADGSPDLVFRGFYAWNSETGSKTAGLAAMYLRGVCMNRNLWGVENFQEIKIRHTKFAADKWSAEAQPALESFANGSSQTLLEGVKAAQDAVVMDDKDSQLEFLTKRAGLSKRMAGAAIARHEKEEGRPMRSVWDAAQGITAIARDVTHQDARIEVESKAGALLNKVAA